MTLKASYLCRPQAIEAALGDVFVIDPTGVGHSYDPLMGKKTEDAFLSAAKHLLYQPDESDKVFTQRAIGMLSRLFTAAKIENVAAISVCTVPNTQQFTKERGATQHVLTRALATRFLYADYKDANFENKFLVSSWETLTAWLEPLLTETVIRSLTHSDFRAEQIMRGDKPVTIYLRWKEQDLLALTPLVRLTLGESLKRADNDL